MNKISKLLVGAAIAIPVYQISKRLIRSIQKDFSDQFQNNKNIEEQSKWTVVDKEHLTNGSYDYDVYTLSSDEDHDNRIEINSIELGFTVDVGDCLEYTKNGFMIKITNEVTILNKPSHIQKYKVIGKYLSFLIPTEEDASHLQPTYNLVIMLDNKKYEIKVDYKLYYNVELNDIVRYSEQGHWIKLYKVLEYSELLYKNEYIILDVQNDGSIIITSIDKSKHKDKIYRLIDIPENFVIEKGRTFKK